ncbi:MAG: hypothetical protein AMS15_06405, partial [Planctomycetes bacterium DG_23]
MTMDTDIRILEVETDFIEYKARQMLVFGRGFAEKDRAAGWTAFRARVKVENKKGETADGHGLMFLAVTWAYPSDVLADAERLEAMKEVALRYADLIRNYKGYGHPVDIHFQTRPALKDIKKEVCQELGLTEEMPLLGALVSASPFDSCLHDGFGKANTISSYAGLGKEFMESDLSTYLGPKYKGKYIADFIRPDFSPRIPIFHLVGGGDKLTSAEIDDSDPKDGLPVSLDQWIGRDGLYCFKVKLKGQDLGWDVDRIVSVTRVIEETLKGEGREEFYTSADANELCPDPEYVLEMLAKVKEKSPLAYDRLLYLEQPTERELSAHRYDMRQIARLKPVVADEGVVDLETLELAQELGWSGVGLKVCKGFSSALVYVAKCESDGLIYTVQDLTNPGVALLWSVGFAARIRTLMGVEYNSRQYFPLASERE